MKKSRLFKLNIIMLVTVLLFGLLCCNQTEDETVVSNEINIYYINRDETFLTEVPVIIESEEMYDKVDEVISYMKTTPSIKTLKADISGELSLNDYIITDDQIYLDFNSTYKALTPSQEILLRAALVKTLCQVEGIKYVAITVEGESLVNRNGLTIGLMNESSFVDIKESALNGVETMEATLYFASEDGHELIPVVREIEYNTNTQVEKALIEELIKGPNNHESYQTINPNTDIIDISVKDQVCYINLSSDFLDGVDKVDSNICIYSIVDTLTELGNISKVQFFVEGESKITFRETVNLDTTFLRNLDLIRDNQ